MVAVMTVGGLAASGCGAHGDDAGAYEVSGAAPSPGHMSPSSIDPATPAPGGDKFQPVGTNPFVMADADPQSTFAADVDTASYDIFRRDMKTGQTPHPDSVRLEEYVNYFQYGYPAPSAETADETPFAIALEAAPSPLNEGLTTLRVGIKARELTSKPRANLVFLVDVSGSMGWADNKLPLVKTTLKYALEVLNADDTVSIVTYAGSTQVALPPTQATQIATITSAIDSLGAGGGTAGAAGMELAYAQAEAAFIDGGINHVIMCTDGDFNVGPSSDKALLDLIEEKRKTGITLTTLGFGSGNLNDGMMETVSNAGNGTYAVIADAAHAESYVARRLLSGLVFVAKDMKIQVNFNPEKVLAYRLLGYENRAIADDDFTNDRVDAGEVGAGHTVTALYEVVLAGGSIPAVPGAPEALSGAPFTGELAVLPGELVRVAVRWKERTSTEEDPAAEVSVGLALDDVALSSAAASSDLKWAVGVAAFAEVLKNSPYGLPDAMAAIEALLEANAGDDPERAELLTLFKSAASAI